MRHVASYAKIALLLGLALAWQGAGIARAHTRVEVGPYAVVIGWESEPVIVGERNALILELSEGDLPVTGTEGSLEVTVRYGDRTFLGNLEPTATPGLYRVPIWPTVRGQYEVLLEGTIGAQAVSELLEPEEVLPAAVLQFPEAPPDVAALQLEVATLASQTRAARWLGLGGIAIGVVGLLIGVLSMRRRRSQERDA